MINPSENLMMNSASGLFGGSGAGASTQNQMDQIMQMMQTFMQMMQTFMGAMGSGGGMSGLPMSGNFGGGSGDGAGLTSFLGAAPAAGGGGGGYGGGGDSVAGAGPMGGFPASNGNSSEAVDIARQYMGQRTGSINLPGFTRNGQDNNNCAEFVSACLDKAGAYKKQPDDASVANLAKNLQKQGWKKVSKEQTQPGDVAVFNGSQHVELVSQAGGKELIGSNNKGSVQYVGTDKGNWGSIEYYSKGSGGGNPAGQDSSSSGGDSVSAPPAAAPGGGGGAPSFGGGAPSAAPGGGGYSPGGGGAPSAAPSGGGGYSPPPMSGGGGDTSAPSSSTGTGSASGGLAGITPYQGDLPDADKWSMCGLIAAQGMARSLGNNMPMSEIKDIALKNGYYSGGMKGPQSEVNLLNKMGIPAHMESGNLDWDKAIKTVQSGRPVIVDTEQHYFVIEGYDPKTGKFDFGNTAKAMKASGGQTMFTPQELSSKLGRRCTPRSLIFTDAPAPGGSHQGQQQQQAEPAKAA